MDWKASGRIDSYEFEKIAVNNLSKSLGKITGVTGGKLTFGYDTELKVSGTLDVVNTNFTNNCLIRVWYVVKANNSAKAERIELCTCFAETSEMDYINGQWSGTINLRSVLARYIDDQIPKNWVFAAYKKGKQEKRALNYFDNFVKSCGGVAVRSGVSNKKYDKNQVYEMGTSPMAILQAIAKHVGGMITCDTHGRMVLRKRHTYNKNNSYYALPSGSYSVTLPGLTYENSTAGTTNRYAVKYTYKDSKGKEKTLWGLAKSASGYGSTSAGRWITQTETLNSMSPKTQKRIDEIAKKRLNANDNVTKYWKLKCFYLPLTDRCLEGKFVRFQYGKLDIDARVWSVDMDLSLGGMLEVTLKEAYRRGSI